LNVANDIIVGLASGILCADPKKAKKNAMLLEPELSKRGTGTGFLLPLFSTKVDWNPATRVLTDQYSPSNLLNAIPRRP
jgi:hypothetical protein